MKTLYSAFGLPLPPAAIIGFVGEEDAGISTEFQRLPSDLLTLDYTLDRRDPLARLRIQRDLMEARRGGATILIASWDVTLLHDLCDEVWWVQQGRVVHRGDPGETLAIFRAEIAARWREEQSGIAATVKPSLRRGDGRAQVSELQLLDSAEQSVLTWSSGEMATVRLAVEFQAPVADPVIGMLIRTRVGVDVYGTNTELEALQLGPRAAGDRLRVTFQFACQLCPGEYTLTVASHDPDGTWHEWLEDAVAFSVCDTRYTAGVANLRAEVSWELY